LLGNLEILRSRRAKLQHAVERLIDSFSEGLIEKEQFKSRMDRTKHRIADLDEDQGECRRCRSTRTPSTCDERFRELAAAIGSELAGANWQRRREIIRTLVQRIDTATEVIKITFRVAQNTRESDRILTPSRSHCRADLKRLRESVEAIGFGKSVQRIVGVRHEPRFCA
jgi:site-specific DNA recombinase